MKTIQKSVLNSTNSTTNGDYFQLAFESGSIKTGVIVLFFISAFVIIPVTYGIIWYEHWHRYAVMATIVAGRRITDDETLDVMKMVVAGKVG